MPASDAIITSGSASYWIDERQFLICHPYYLKGYRVSPTQFRLYAFLYAHPGEIFSEQDIIREVWGAEPYIERKPDNVRVQVRGLRRAVGDVGIVDTIRRYGYGVGI